MGSSWVGGLIGGNAGGGANCYATGAVSDGEQVGGLVGYQERGTFTASFWDTEATGQLTSEVGTGKTTEQMRKASAFLEVGWDFVGEITNGTEDIWWIEEGKDYPRLWWEAATEETRSTNIGIRNNIQ